MTSAPWAAISAPPPEYELAVCRRQARGPRSISANYQKFVHLDQGLVIAAYGGSMRNLHPAYTLSITSFSAAGIPSMRAVESRRRRWARTQTFSKAMNRFHGVQGAGLQADRFHALDGLALFAVGAHRSDLPCVYYFRRRRVQSVGRRNESA